MPKKESSSVLKKISDKMPDLSTRQKVAAGLGLAATAAAGLAAIRAARAKARPESSGAVVDVEPPIVYHLEPHGGGWRIRLEGAPGEAEAYFETKAQGLENARELAREQSPSELVVYRSDGSEQRRHHY